MISLIGFPKRQNESQSGWQRHEKCMTCPTLPLIGYESLPSFVGLLRFSQVEWNWSGLGLGYEFHGSIPSVDGVETGLRGMKPTYICHRL